MYCCYSIDLMLDLLLDLNTNLVDNCLRDFAVALDLDSIVVAYYCTLNDDDNHCHSLNTCHPSIDNPYDVDNIVDCALPRRIDYDNHFLRRHRHCHYRQHYMPTNAGAAVTVAAMVAESVVALLDSNSIGCVDSHRLIDDNYCNSLDHIYCNYYTVHYNPVEIQDTDSQCDMQWPPVFVMLSFLRTVIDHIVMVAAPLPLVNEVKQCMSFYLNDVQQMDPMTWMMMMLMIVHLFVHVLFQSLNFRSYLCYLLALL